MRKVKVYKYEKREEKNEEYPRGRTYFEKVEDGEGVFHTWGSDYEEFESGPGNYTTAVIERADGKIETPPAHMVEFILPNPKES
jgi:hypothetical protein